MSNVGGLADIAWNGSTLPIIADTGWTANSTAGDKTVIVAAFTNGVNGTMVTALNLAYTDFGTAVAAIGTQLEVVTKKLAALETSLVAGKLPNA